MENQNARPVYEWDAAEVGDTAPDKTVAVTPALVALYARTSDDDNPLYTDERFARAHGFDGLAVPVSMAVRMAPGKRSTIIKHKGYQHPVRPTPFARWQCETFVPVKPGDVITSESFLDEKYEKRGRKYLVWKVIGRNQRGEIVVIHRATNVWEGSKPDDRVR
jgi:3-hydroxybutyryl-CoA dehydratase